MLFENISKIVNWELPYCNPSNGDYSSPPLQVLFSIIKFEFSWFFSFVFLSPLTIILFCLLKKRYKLAIVLFCLYLIPAVLMILAISCD